MWVWLHLAPYVRQAVLFQCITYLVCQVLEWYQVGHFFLPLWKRASWIAVSRRDTAERTRHRRGGSPGGKARLKNFP